MFRAKHFVACSVAMEKNADVHDTAQCAVYIHGVNVDYQLMEGLIEQVRIKHTGAGNNLLQLVNLVNKSEFLWENMFGFVGDGVAAKLNKLKKFEGTTTFLTVHSILHQEALCKGFQDESRNGHCYTNCDFICASVLNFREFVALTYCKK